MRQRSSDLSHHRAAASIPTIPGRGSGAWRTGTARCLQRRSGAVFKPLPNLLINAAIWQIYLAQEFVYGGDGGTVDFNGKTRRYGFDFSGRYEPLKSCM